MDKDGIQITVTSKNGGGETTQQWVMAQSDMDAFQEWVVAAYGGNPAPVPVKEPEQRDDSVPITPDEAMAAWAKATLQGTADNVNRHHQLKAAQDAAASFPPVNIEPPPESKD